MIKTTLFSTFYIMFNLCISSYAQQNISHDEKKKLVIINNKTQKLWTNKEYRDSINWAKVKNINIIPDSTAIRKYGEKGKNGAVIVQYK